MIKNQILSVIVSIFVVISSASWLTSSGSSASDEVQLSSITASNQELQEMMFFDPADRLNELESRLNSLFEELSTLRKSLTCIQCETNNQEQVSIRACKSTIKLVS